MQRGKEGIEGFAQLVLGFVLLVHRFFAGMLLAVLLVAGLEFVEAGPLLHEFGHGLFSGFVVQHFEQLRGDGFDAGLVLDEPFHARREVAVNELHELFAPAFVKLADDGDVLNLLVGEFAVGAVNLGEDVPGINEEDAVVGLGLVEEPERGRKRDGVEHVRGQRQHGVDEILLDQRAADVGLGMARVGGGVGHDERGAAFRLQRSGKEIDPKIIRVRDGFLALCLFSWPSISCAGCRRC